MSSFPLSLLFLACSPGSGPAGADPAAPDLEVELSEVVPTVPTVSGQVGGGEAAWIRWGLDGVLDQRLDLALDAEGRFAQPLLGLKAGRDYVLQVETESGLQSAQAGLTTGSPPPNLPAIEVEWIDPDRTNGGFLVTGLVVPPTALVLDRDGDPVWWYQPEGVETLGRVRLARDGQRVLMADLNLQAEPATELISVSVDGRDELRRPTSYQHHDFVERADGTIAYSAYDPREIDGEVQEGDRILELSPDGSTVEVYNQWDHHPFVQPPPSETAWPHANALDQVDAGGQDAYLLSLLFIGGIARIDRATGEEDWFLGGPEGTLRAPDGREIFLDYQHGMDLVDDRLKVFVNGVHEEASRVVELQLDPAQGLATETWSYQADPVLYSPVMGDVQVLPGGNVLVTFSFNGELHEISAEGELLWRLSAALTGSVSYTTWLEQLQ